MHRKNENIPKGLVKAFIIRGGSKQDRQDRFTRLLAEDTTNMFCKYESTNELVILFFCNDLFVGKLSFEEAKKLAGETVLKPEFSTSILASPQPAFGVIQLAEKNITAINNAEDSSVPHIGK